MTSSITVPRSARQTNARFLARVLEVMPPELHARALPGESPAAAAARADAAADILDELAYEFRGDDPADKFELGRAA